MAIQSRRGLEADFQPSKMVDGETAGLLDTKKVFYTFAPGDCRRLATHEEMTEMIDESVGGIKQGFTADLTQAITDAETATATANASAQNAEDKSLLADEAKDRANQAAADAESIVLEKIATDTTVGVVKSGGDVTVEIDGTMSVNEASNANVTVIESAEDGEITTGLLSAIIGLIKKKFSVVLNGLAGKLDKSSMVQSAEISDATKPVSSVVTAWLASQISSLSTTLSQLNNNLAVQSGSATINESLVSGTVAYVVKSKICTVTINVTLLAAITTDSSIASGLPTALIDSVTSAMGWVAPSISTGFYLQNGGTHLMAKGDAGLYYCSFSYPVA